MLKRLQITKNLTRHFSTTSCDRQFVSRYEKDLPMNKIIITLVSFALCACTNKNSVSEYSSWKGSSAYSPKIHNFSSYYSNLKDRKVIYKESFIGNFTLYYNPKKLTQILLLSHKSIVFLLTWNLRTPGRQLMK
mgnify:CR=1 FL=1